jgi:hypothetical protein
VEFVLIALIVVQRALRFFEERHHREENPRAVIPDSDEDYWDAADDVLKQMARIEREAQ